MKKYFFLLLGFASCSLTAQELTGVELLEKSIAFHDPANTWKHFDGKLQIRMEIPNAPPRLSDIYMNLPQEVFKLQVARDKDTYTYQFKGADCEMTLNGEKEIASEDQKRLRLNCERGTMMRNYYTYLYGLPMKLKDPGTQLGEKVVRKKFKGKEYLVLKVTYDQNVGDDTWYFYFDPKTYAMEVYQFYHDESKNDGEYILLTGLSEIGGIKMPKTRAWYYNKDDKHLGTDFLVD